MLVFVKEHDYAVYSQNVEKLTEMFNTQEESCDKSVLDFFYSAKEKIGTILDACNTTNEYARWCQTPEAIEISYFAKSIVDTQSQSEMSEIVALIIMCADEAAYLVSSKCAHFYTED